MANLAYSNPRVLWQMQGFFYFLFTGTFPLNLACYICWLTVHNKIGGRRSHSGL